MTVAARVVRRVRQALLALIGAIVCLGGLTTTVGRDAVILSAGGLLVTAYALVALFEKDTTREPLRPAPRDRVAPVRHRRLR